MKADQERVSNLLTDTVTLLCRNGLQYKTEMKVQGLLGITLDDEVFLVQIDKRFGDLIAADMVRVHANTELEEKDSSGGEMSDNSISSLGRKRHRRKRRKTNGSMGTDSEMSESKISKVVVKSERLDEEDEELIVLESDSKIGLHDKDSMRESYGVSYETDATPKLLHAINSSVDSSIKIDNHFQNNTSQSLDGSQLGGDPPGCSTWDDPLSALTDQNSSYAPKGESSSGGDDTMDQQTMSTFVVGSMSSSGLIRPNHKPSTITHRLNESGQKSVTSQDQDDRLWQCSQCYKSYFSKRNLTTHMMKKHGVLEVDGTQVSYKCNIPGCESKYNRRDNLLAHKRRAHGIMTIPARNSTGLNLDTTTDVNFMYQIYN